MSGERANVAAFIDLDLLPVVDEVRALCHLAAERTGPDAALCALAARLDDLYLNTLSLWLTYLQEPATQNAAGQ